MQGCHHAAAPQPPAAAGQACPAHQQASQPTLPTHPASHLRAAWRCSKPPVAAAAAPPPAHPVARDDVGDPGIHPHEVRGQGIQRGPPHRLNGRPPDLWQSGKTRRRRGGEQTKRKQGSGSGSGLRRRHGSCALRACCPQPPRPASLWPLSASTPAALPARVPWRRWPRDRCPPITQFPDPLSQLTGSWML